MKTLKKITCKLGGLICILTAAVLFTCERVPDYCGKGEWYNPDHQFCFANKAFNLCGGKDYNPLIQGCDVNRNAVGTRCLNDTFVPVGTPCGGFTLSTASAPADGGDIQRSADGPNYAAGEQVTLVAMATDGFTFAGWTGAQSTPSPDVTVTMNSNMPLIAMFKPTSQTLATTAFPPDGGTIDRVENGMEVTVTAITAPNYTFTNWAGAVTSTEASVTVTVDEGKTLVAIFTPNRHTLTVNANPAASGIIFVNGTAESGETRHDAGTQVSVAARAMEGFVFTGWSGAATGTSNPVTINMTNNNQTLTANFERGSGGNGGDNGEGHGHFNPNITYGFFTDERDGTTYRTVRIGTQTWMAENLNWAGDGGGLGWCYDNDPDNCKIYGRLYDWATVMELDPGCNTTECANQVQSTHRGICPEGWHVPSDAEWEKLVDFAGGSLVAGTQLRALTSWRRGPWSADTLTPGTDYHGFSALPGGFRTSYNYGTYWEFLDVGISGIWWSATTGYDEDLAWCRGMSYISNAHRCHWGKTVGISLRCVESTNQPTSHALQVVANPPNGGTVTGGGSYADGTQVTITATASPGWVFTHWSGAVDITNASSMNTSISMDAPKTVTANFAQGFTIAAGDVSFDMVYVEGGTFTMGCTPEQHDYCRDLELVPHQVTLTNSYYIGKFQVTQALWVAVMGRDNNPSWYPESGQHPVEMVSWDMIVNDFIPALNALTGRTFRLPTEAEWEFAARGGNHSGGFVFSGSNDIDDVAWYHGNSTVVVTGIRRPHPVGGKLPNELGIFDMSGNVWEFVNDYWLHGYTADAKTDPTGPTSDGGGRVLRGGNFNMDALGSQVFYRGQTTSINGNGSIGFRLALSL